MNLDNLIFIQTRLRSKSQRPTAISIRVSGNTSDVGSAKAIALAWHKERDNQKNTHYVVDSENIVRTEWDYLQDGLGQKGVVSITVSSNLFYEKEQWFEGNQEQAYRNTAKLVAAICDKYGVRPRYIDSNSSDWLSWKTRRRGGIMLETIGVWPDDFLPLVNEYRKN